MWLALLLLGGPGLWIGSTTDCPSAAQVREQIAPLLPAEMTVVDTGDAPPPADADRGEVVVDGAERRVRLRGPDERYNHERALPPALSCAEAARTAAVLIAAWEFQGQADARAAAGGERDGAVPAAKPPEAGPEPTLVEIDRSLPPPAPPKEPRLARAHPRVAPRVPVPNPSDEVAIVRDALERLRGEKDAGAALRLLDEHDRRFPDGLLRDEAAVTRIEALMALGRDGEALQRLEVLPPALLDRSPRLRVTRGELRAAQGRCPEALGDFAVVAASNPAGEIARRIERGRAACNSATPRNTGESGGNR